MEPKRWTGSGKQQYTHTHKYTHTQAGVVTLFSEEEEEVGGEGSGSVLEQTGVFLITLWGFAGPPAGVALLHYDTLCTQHSKEQNFRKLLKRPLLVRVRLGVNSPPLSSSRPASAAEETIWAWLQRGLTMCSWMRYLATSTTVSKERFRIFCAQSQISSHAASVTSCLYDCTSSVNSAWMWGGEVSRVCVCVCVSQCVCMCVPGRFSGPGWAVEAC